MNPALKSRSRPHRRSKSQHANRSTSPSHHEPLHSSGSCVQEGSSQRSPVYLQAVGGGELVCGPEQRTSKKVPAGIACADDARIALRQRELVGDVGAGQLERPMLSHLNANARIERVVLLEALLILNIRVAVADMGPCEIEIDLTPRGA